MIVGDAVGDAVGVPVGAPVGEELGEFDGAPVGAKLSNPHPEILTWHVAPVAPTSVVTVPLV